MCISKNECKCHLLKNAIEQDNEGKFKTFFSKTVNTELYFFLYYGYRLQETTDVEQFRISLRHLIIKFFQGKFELNLGSNERQQFLAQCDHFIEGGSKEKMDEALLKLIENIQGQTYRNLGAQFGFKDYLCQFEENKTITQEINTGTFAP